MTPTGILFHSSAVVGSLLGYNGWGFVVGFFCNIEFEEKYQTSRS